MPEDNAPASTNIGGLTPLNTTITTPVVATTSTNILTQADIDKAAKKAAADAAKAERDKLDAYLAEEAAKQDREKLDAQAKAEAERDEERQKREALERELATTRHNVAVQARLANAGVTHDTTADVARLIDVEVGSNEQDIDSAIEALKERLPQLFGTATSTPTTVRPSTPPTARVSGGQIDPARERARQRHGYTPQNAA